MQTTALNLERQEAASSAARGVALKLVFLMALIGALSALFFSGASLRLDEAQSLWQSGRSMGDILTIVAQDVHVPLYHELLHYWRLTVGDSVLWARAFSLIFYILLVPAIYFLGKLAYGRQAGLFAATLIAVSPFMQWYGNEIRMYTLFTFLTVINQYCFIKLWRGPSEHAWAGYVLTALLGVFTHYFFFLTLLSQAMFYFLRRRLFEPDALRRFMLAGALVVAAFVPWAVFVFSQGQAQNASPVLTAPTTVNLFATFSQFVFGFQDDHLSTFFLSLWPVTIILGFLALRKSSRIQPETEYFMLTVVMSVSLAFFGSFFLAPVFVSRYLIFTVPSLYLLLTSLIALYPPRAATLTRAALVGVMVLMLGVEIANPATPVKENYREASEYLTEHAAPQDVVVLSAPFTIYPIEYYYRGVAPLSTLPAWDRYAYGPIPPFDATKLPEEVKALETHQYAWVLLSYDQGYEKTVKDYFDQHYERVSVQSFSKDLNLYEYKLRYDTPLSKQTALAQ